jgi:uncharacterized membrane protein
MKKTIKLSSVIAASLLSTALLTGCGGGSSSSDNTVSEGTAAYVTENTELKGDFTEDVTLDASKVYKITGEVNFLEGTTLTIPAGTKLYGSTQSSYLAINKGAKIEASGTAAKPIIFTSAADYAGTSNKDAQGEWGGLTIIGDAPIVGGTKTYEAGTQVGGGDNAEDNSGTLEYVMIKHTGYEVETDKELNGLSLLAVGNGTTIDNVAILGGADDGIELWGGTVDVTNLYVYNAGDDSIDTDLGYQGTIDNAVVVQKVVDKTNYDSSAIENGNDSDSYTSDASSTTIATMPTMPTLKNITIDAVGGAIYLKNDAGGIFDNVVVNTVASTVDGQATNTAQAVVTHRTTDTVDDLSDPAGVTIQGNGIILNNEVNSSAVFAVETAKGTSDGGSAAADHISNYWENVANDGADLTANTYTGKMFISSVSADEDAPANAAVNSSNARLVTGADQTVFDWVLGTVTATETEVLSGDITSDMTLSEGTNYALNGEVNVKNGATLTIEPGVTVYGLTASSYLAINAGSKIEAAGTKAKPIVFTSAQDVAGLNGDTTVQGQWGGLTIIGNAPIVGGTKTYEAGTQVGGGDDAEDNSGTLQYVMIKNSGYEVEADKELNGLSLLAVGSGTTIENVAILSGSDDGIEMWGGSVDVTNLYVYDAGDDSIDTDLGYTGTVSNAFVQQLNVDKTNYDSSAIENGNDSDSYDSSATSGTYSASATDGDQATRPTFENITLEAVGGAIYLKNDAGGIFDNVLVTTKASTVAGQSDTTNQAVVTHRTTDVVDDLSGTPTGVEIKSGGLALINEVTPSAIYAIETAKGTSDGGSDSATHISTYWGAVTGNADISEGSAGTVTGATTANIWKGKAGSND